MRQQTMATFRVLAICAALTLSGCTGGHAAVQRGAAPVGWIDSPGSLPSLPLAPAPSRPPTNARPCRASDLAASVAGQDGASQNLFFYVRLRNVSHSTCVLLGTPTVVATAPRQPDVTASSSSFFGSGPNGNMAPGQATYVDLDVPEICAAHPDGVAYRGTYRRITIGVPTGGTVSTEQTGRALSLTCGLGVGPFVGPTPAVRAPAPPLSRLTASIEAPPPVRAGVPFAYVVDLANPTARAVSLSPCPSYLEATSTPPVVKDRYRLNCSAAASIAPGQRLRFSMRMAIPTGAPPGTVTIIWDLLTGPIARATVTVSG